MPGEVESLQIEIKADAEKASDSLEKLTGYLEQLQTALKGIAKSDGIKDVSKNISDMTSKVASAAKNISKDIGTSKKPIEKVAKSLDDITSKYANLGKDFQFFGDSQSTQKQIDKFSNALETAKIKQQELEAAGKTDGKMYEAAIMNVQKYTNIVDALKAKLNQKVEFTGNLSLMSDEELDNWFQNLPSIKAQAEQAGTQIEQMAEQVADSFKEIGEPLKTVDLSLANLSNNAAQALSAPQSEAVKTATAFSKLKDITGGVSEKFMEMGGRMENALVSSGIKTYTSDYQTLQKEVDATREKIASLNAQMAKSEATSKNFKGSTSYKKLQYDISEAKKELQRLLATQDKLDVAGKSTKWNFSGLQNQLSGLSKGFSSFGRTFGAIDKKLSLFGGKLLSAITPLGAVKKSVDRLGLSNEGLVKSLTKLSRMFSMMMTYRLFGSVIDGVKVGFQNLVQYSDETNRSLSMLMNSLNQLKNSFAAAVAPILNAFAPALDFLIQKVISVVNAINQMISALLGNSSYIRAKKLTDDYASSLKEAGKAAEELYTTTLGIDELNIISPPTQQSGTADSGGTGAADMFETVPIDDWFLEAAEKIREILSKLFAPLKKAWDEVGEFVMDSWKFALEEVWGLAKSIGRDFLTVWNQDETVDMFKNILYIIGDIGLVVGHLASGLNEAWSYNETGLHILENIRDIFAVVISNIRVMADATVAWAEKLDFSPLLGQIEAWTASLVPVFDNLSGMIGDFYTDVLLPLGTWAIEDGLPKLLQVFIDFNNNVDWEGLRERLGQFWTHLEPFAETVGEGLIEFIDRISDALAGFVNSEGFDGFLTSVENWMDNVSVDDVANSFERIAKALIGLKIAVIGFSVISGITGVFSVLTKFFAFLSGIGNTIGKIIAPLKNVGTVISEIGTKISAFIGSASTIGTIGTAIAGIGSVVTGAFTAIFNFVDMLRNGFSWLNEVLMVLGTALAAVGAVILGAPALVAGVVAGIVAAVGTAVVVIKDNWEAIKEFFVGLPETVGTAIESVKTFVMGIPEWWGGVWENVKTTVGTAWDSIVQWFSELPGKIAFALGYAFGTIAEWGVNVFNWAITEVPKIIENIVQWWVDLKDKIFEKINLFITETLPMWVENVKLFFTDTIPNTLATIAETFITFKDKVFEKINLFITETLPQWKDDVVSFFSEKVPEIISEVVEFFGDLPEKLMEVGKNAISGLWEGFTNKWEELKSGITEFKDKFVEGFNTAFDINSPSKVMESIGGFAKDGLLVPFLNPDDGGIISGFVNGIVGLIQNSFNGDATAFSGILVSLQAAWSEANTWWTAEMSRWHTENVLPWFDSEKWMLVYASIKTSLQATWDETLIWWDAAIYRWYNDDVAPYFTKEKWTWPGIKDGLVASFEAATEACKKVWNTFAQHMNENMKLKIDPIVVDGQTVFSGQTINLGTWPTFAQGGFPDVGDIFIANEVGPELIGTIGGRPAVASNNEITGIRDAVYDSGEVNAQLLNTAIELLRIIAAKDLSVSIGDREIVEANRRGEARMGYRFT